PRMSAAAVEGRLQDVRADLSRGIRLTAAVLVPATVLFIVLGRYLTTMLFAHGNTSVGDARYIGWTLAAFAVSLLPFSVFQLQLRAFYALHDTRTPAMVNITVNVVNVAAAVALYLALPAHYRVIGLAAGYSLSYFAGGWLFARRLHARLQGLEGSRTIRTLVRLTLASVLAAIPAGVAGWLVAAVAGSGWVAAMAALAAGMLAGLPIFLRLTHVFDVPEVLAVIGLLLRPAL